MKKIQGNYEKAEGQQWWGLNDSECKIVFYLLGLQIKYFIQF